MASIDPEIAKQYIADAITDSIDMDWTSESGASSVLSMFRSEGWHLSDCDPATARLSGVRAGIVYGSIATLAGCGAAAMAFAWLSS